MVEAQTKHWFDLITNICHNHLYKCMQFVQLRTDIIVSRRDVLHMKLLLGRMDVLVWLVTMGLHGF